ncbi:MAG: tryptophan synthase subunit alpha [archaeon]
MSRVSGAFLNKAFVPFTVLGDPDFDTSLEVVKSMIDAGADMLELGFPFSDPVADGPVIQLADKRALDGGMDVDSCFRLIKSISEYSKVPISLLVYSNLVFRRGIDKFYADAAKAGVDAVLVADIPYEEASEYVAAALKYGIDPVFLVAQTTTDGRLSSILKYARGYIYLVSVLGVTGERRKIEDETVELIKRVKKAASIPVAVGFGVSLPVHAQKIVASGADGVIVGSAIVKIIERNLSDKKKMIREIGDFVREMKKALRGMQ